MIQIPTPYSLLVVQRSTGASLDALGNAVTGWSVPVAWPVHAWHQGPSPEAVRQGREVSSVAVTVYAPTAPLVQEDRVTIGADTFEVIGPPADWTNGPWANPVAGFEVQLKRMEG